MKPKDNFVEIDGTSPAPVQHQRMFLTGRKNIIQKNFLKFRHRYVIWAGVTYYRLELQSLVFYSYL